MLLCVLQVFPVACQHSKKVTTDADRYADSATAPDNSSDSSSKTDSNSVSAENQWDSSNVDSESATASTIDPKENDTAISDTETIMDTATVHGQVDTATETMHDTSSGDTESASDSDACYIGTVFYNPSSEDAESMQSWSCIIGDVSINGNGENVTLINLPRLKRIDGRLSISNLTAVHDLNGLSSLETVTGQIDIHLNDGLESLAGLESLKNVNEIYIKSNANLKNISALSQLETLSYISVSDNDILESLIGLNGLKMVTDGIQLLGNSSLYDIGALEKVTLDGCSVNIVENPMLPRCQVCELKSRIVAPKKFVTFANLADECPAACTTELSLNSDGCIAGDMVVENEADIAVLSPHTCINGSLQIIPQTLESVYLPNLLSVASNLTIGDNSGHSAQFLTTLEGLSTLESVGGPLIINKVPVLTDLDGLENLHSVSALRVREVTALTSLAALSHVTELKTLSIFNNPSLTSLGLDGLTTVTEDISVAGNTALPQCDVFALIERLEDDMYLTCIEDNNQESDEDTDRCEDFCPTVPIE
ncbi:MAG: hypothetical protein JXX14_06235 [Deltaproteobacteria bacterium]|nr:hypothetical protein [Deltaproteobacteria bacterium]